MNSSKVFVESEFFLHLSFNNQKLYNYEKCKKNDKK